MFGDSFEHGLELPTQQPNKKANSRALLTFLGFLVAHGVGESQSQGWKP